MAEQSWTDDPITAVPVIRRKVIHFTELQDAINEYENRYSIAAGITSWTDSPAVKVKIRETVITEMQDALDALYQLANSTDFSWSETPIKSTIVKPTHVNELRTNMNIMQDQFCIGCDSCDDYTGCACNTACHTDVCSQCNTSCYWVYDKGGCNECYYVCNVDGCDLCYGQCYTNTCQQCHVGSFRYPWF